jgi:biopolymer transport protein ExbB
MQRALPFAWIHPLLVAVALSLGASSAHAWWNSEWTVRKKVTIDPAAAGAPLTSATNPGAVLVRLHDGNFSFGAAKSDGSDLRVVAGDDLTPLAFQLEKFDPLLNEAFLWVKLPDLKPGAPLSFWLYYGNAGATAQSPGKPFDGDTVLVYHFSEHGQAPIDASGVGNTATEVGLSNDGSMIGTGLRLDGRSTITIPGTPSLAWSQGGAFTWSAWVKLGAPAPSSVIYRRPAGITGGVLAIGADQGMPFVAVREAGATLRTAPAAPLAPGTWHQWTVTGEGGKMTLMVDGAEYATVATELPAADGPSILGGSGDGANFGFVGEVDELEISRVARTPAAVKLAFLAQGGDTAGKFLTLADDERPKNWLSFLKTGYVGVILGSLSIDGWVVIGILFIMGLISWAVMIGKASYLNRVVRGNELFLTAWEGVAGDLSGFDFRDEERARSVNGKLSAADLRIMRSAPIYRIYRIGMSEVRRRALADHHAFEAGLSGRSIQAIRASLDGGLVRETQRLNSQMVLLTIAISGGPFLGLLGTVVGVMITFAAVAAAGDVNVNAIAPGIAAALAATVAGLAVAIPSLFGYNYLLTRSKAVGSDLHVFIDEFVAKMAEHHSDEA